MFNKSIDILELPTKKIEQFNDAGVYTIKDMVDYAPKKYIDFSKIVKIADIPNLIKDEKQKIEKRGESADNVGVFCSIIIKVENIDNRPKKKYLSVWGHDGSGKGIKITWFNQNYLSREIYQSVSFIFCGKVTISSYNGNEYIEMVNPMFFGCNEKVEELQRIVPVYKKIKGMSDQYLINTIQSALKHIPDDYLEEDLRNKYNFIPQKEAYINIHGPKDAKQYKDAKNRLIFDDMFMFNFHLKNMQENNQKESVFNIKKFCKVKQLLKSLPFELTDGQSEVLREISQKMKDNKHVNALVQGDVGCGKTMVATMLLVLAAENGYQGALIAPTNILAEQHYVEINKLLEPLNISVEKVTGSITARQKNSIKKRIENGEVQIVIGTHALIQKDVKFKDLAVLVVDEQHRFGVEQKEVLLNQSERAPHNIVMSATPIPRTLSMALYGNALDVYTIKSLPKGRKPVITKHLNDSNQTYEFMLQEIKNGRQCYVVCPLIEDSENMTEVDSAVTTYNDIKKWFKNKGDYEISLVNGKMKKDEIEAEIQRFARNDSQILVATTVIEVGINVPNASVIVVKNAERFGLAQLHQLRGRVGRGEYQSYCVLESEKQNEKLEVMVKTSDGFIIAEEDLRIRGGGDYFGLKQSGQNKYINLMIAYPDSFKKVKDLIFELYNNKEKFNKYKHLIDVNISDKSK